VSDKPTTPPVLPDISPERIARLADDMLTWDGHRMRGGAVREFRDVLLALSQALQQAREEIAVDEKLLKGRDELLAAIPQCPDHGPCIPHALEWIAKARAAEAELAYYKLRWPEIDADWKVQNLQRHLEALRDQTPQEGQ